MAANNKGEKTFHGAFDYDNRSAKLVLEHMLVHSVLTYQMRASQQSAEMKLTCSSELYMTGSTLQP